MRRTMEYDEYETPPDWRERPVGVPGSLCDPLQRVHGRRGLDELVQLEGAIISLPFLGIPQQLRIIGDDFRIGVPDRFRLDIDKPVNLFLRECLA